MNEKDLYLELKKDIYDNYPYKRNENKGENMETVSQVINGYWRQRFLLNNTDKKAYELMNESLRLRFISDEDVDWESVKKLENNKNAFSFSAYYPIFAVGNFVDGVAKVEWTLYPDGRYFMDEDGYGMKDNDETVIYGRINKKCQVVEKFHPKLNEKTPLNEKMAAKADSSDDSLLIDTVPFTINDDKPLIIKEDKKLKKSKFILHDYLVALRNCRDQLDKQITSINNYFDIKELEENVIVIKIQESYSLINIGNGESRVLIDNRGRILFNETEDPEAICKSLLVTDDEIYDVLVIKDIFLECLAVLKSGLSVIRIDKTDYSKSCKVYQDEYDINGEWIGSQEVDYCNFHPNIIYFCILDQKFNVIVPVCELKDLDKSFNPELISDEEWKEIWKDLKNDNITFEINED